MKLYVLDMTMYQVEEADGKPIDYPLRKNYSDWLMTPGIADNGEDFTIAYMFATNLVKDEVNTYLATEHEVRVLKDAINKLLEATQRGQAAFGGRIHAEAIARVFNIQENEPKED